MPRKTPSALIALLLTLVLLTAAAPAQTVEYFGLQGLSDFFDNVDFTQPTDGIGFSEFPDVNGLNGNAYAAQGVTIVQRDGHPLNTFLPGFPGTSPGFFPGNGFNAHVLSSTGQNGPGNPQLSDNIDFVFSIQVTAVTIWIGNIGPGSTTEVQFLAANGSIIASEVFDTSHAGIEGTPDGNNRIFYGVTTTIPIKRVRTIEPGGDGDAVCYDELDFGQSLAAANGDFDPPTVMITAPVNGAIVGSSPVAVSADVSDASPTTVTSTPAGLFVNLAAGGGTATGSIPLADGPHLICVNALDAFANSGGDSVSITVDTTAPVLMIESPAEGAVLASGTVTVVVTVTDLTATTVVIGSVAVPVSGGQATATVSLSEGPNMIEVTATDAANHSTVAIRNVVYDANAPSVTILTPADGATFGLGEASVPVNATVTDLSQTDVVSSPLGIDTTLAAGGGPVSGMVTIGEGLTTISISATDAAGRVGSAFVCVLLDTTPPVVTLESPPDGGNVRGVIDLHADAADVLPGTGVTSVAFLIDGTVRATLTAEPYEIAFDTALLADGPHTFTAVATDGKGNSASASATARVDNTPPSVAITTPADGAFVAGNVPFVAAASDGGSGLGSVTMRANGAAPDVDGSIVYGVPPTSDLRTSQVTSTMLPDGSLLLTATAKDAAGNEAATSITVTVDNTAPQKMLITPTDGSIVSGALLIQAAASDAHLASLSLLINDVLFLVTTASTLSTTIQTTTISDGPLKITIVAMDLSGNSSTCNATVIVDNMVFKLNPQTLNLKSKGGANSVTAQITGANASLMVPTESRAIELRVPGGSPVPSTQGWPGDDAVTVVGGLPELTVKFDRQALITAIRAGIAGGAIPPGGPVTVTLVSAGRTIGTDSVTIVGQ